MPNIEVKMGKTAVSDGTGNLTASGIGSCLVITLYSAKARIAAMAHAMLTCRESCDTPAATRDVRYIDAAIVEMLEKMSASGVCKTDLEAKLVGGANMFSAFESDIGANNVLSAKSKLKKEGIKLVGECVGGSIGRSVEFAVSTGVMTVKTKF